MEDSERGWLWLGDGYPLDEMNAAVDADTLMERIGTLEPTVWRYLGTVAEKITGSAYTEALSEILRAIGRTKELLHQDRVDYAIIRAEVNHIHALCWLSNCCILSWRFEHDPTSMLSRDAMSSLTKQIKSMNAKAAAKQRHEQTTHLAKARARDIALDKWANNEELTLRQLSVDIADDLKRSRKKGWDVQPRTVETWIGDLQPQHKKKGGRPLKRARP